MSRTWAYLDTTTHQKYTDKAKSLGISEGDLTQRLIHIFMTTPIGETQLKTCLNCPYYQVATSHAMQALKKLNEALTLIQPQYMRERNKEY